MISSPQSAEPKSSSVTTAHRDAALFQQFGQGILWVSDYKYRLFDVRRFERG